jgi:serine/threonine-protein kinase
MQPVTEAAGAYGAGAAPVGGGMLPGGPVDDEYQTYTRRDRRPEPSGGTRWGPIVLLLLALLVVAGLVTYVVMKLGSGNAPPPPTRIAVADVVNKTLAEARATLTAQKFTQIVTTTAESDKPRGTVIEQDPKAGETALPGDKITLTVSAGKGKVAVPPLQNVTQEEAVKRLRAAGLQLGLTETVDDPTVDANKVVKSDPPSGTSVDKGSAVKLTLASGLVQLEDLKDQDLASASAKLATLNLIAKVVYEDAAEGVEPNVVLRTDPGPGKVKVGSTVTLVVSRAATPTPSVTPSETVSPSPTDSPSP